MSLTNKNQAVFLGRIFLAVLAMSVDVSLRGQIYRDDMESASFVGVLKEYKDITVPVPWAKIQLKGSDKVTYSDGRGFFAFGGLSGWSGAGATALIISADEYETLEFPVEPGQTDVGVIFLRPLMRILNPVTVNELMPAGGETSAGAINRPGAAALYFGDDLVMSAANYRLGMLGFKPRGYDRRNVEFYINGASFDDPELGFAHADMFTGLNTLYKYGEGDMRLINDDMLYGDAGGFSNIRINPLGMQRRFRASYIFGNSLFTHGLNLGYSTGEMPGGLALNLMLSARTGVGFAEGTNYDGLSYLFAVGKDFDEFNRVNFFVLGAPTKRGGLNYSTQRVYDAAGDNRYNSAWGYDNGKRRNARETQFHRPTLGLEYAREGEISQWNTSLAFTFGHETATELLWADLVPTPTPDPFSYSGQVRWDLMREANDTTIDRRARYITAGQRSGASMISLNSVYDLYDWGKWATTAGFDLKLYHGSFSGKADDLLGGGYWLNVDKFRPEDLPSNPDYYQFDLDSPNRRVGEGGGIGYDYSVQYRSYRLWNIWRYFMNRFKFSLGGSVSLVAYEYAQNTTNGKFPSESTNKRPRQNFFNYTGKAGVAYKLNAASSVEINGMYGKRAPLFSDAYSAPRITGETVENLRNETLIAGDLNYLFANPLLDIRASGFFTQTMNRSMVRGYYDDDCMSRMSLGVSGLSTRHFGGDLSAKVKITSEISLNLAASYGIYKYCSDPSATLIQENTGEKQVLRDTLRLSGKRVGGTPQTAFSGGAMYDSPQRWWAGFNANYAASNYIDVNPLRFGSTSVDLGNEQAKLKSVFTLDLYGGYTFEFGEKKKKAIGLNVNVQNILGTKNGCLGAYEPFGVITADNAGKHDPHYAYAYGRTVYLMLSFVF